MVSTINVNTMATVMSFASAFSLGLIAVFVLLFLLVQVEAAAPAANSWAKALRRALYIGIIPLLIIFVLNVIIKLAQILG